MGCSAISRNDKRPEAHYFGLFSGLEPSSLCTGIPTFKELSSTFCTMSHLPHRYPLLIYVLLQDLTPSPTLNNRSDIISPGKLGACGITDQFIDTPFERLILMK
jgi:hypothetical protein